MTVVKQIGFGASISVKGTTASTTTYVLIGGIVSAGGPDGTGTAIDVSTLDSTDRFIEKIGGMVDSGQLSMIVAYNNSDTSSKTLGTLYTSGVLQTVKVAFPSTAATDETFTAFVNGMGRAIERDGMITRPVTLDVSGNPGFLTT